MSETGRRGSDGPTTERLTGTPRLGPRYAVALLPGRGGGGALPDRELALSLPGVGTDQLAAYSRVCGFAVDGTLPVTYPQVLAFGAQIKLMTGAGFPLRLPGLVHVRQRMRLYRAIGADEPLELRVRAERLRPHPRGAQVDLVADVSVAGEPVWRGRSGYLSRGATAQASPTEPDEPEPTEVTAPLSARWDLAGDTGRRYASVSGDVNPIHLHPLTARLFGFPGAIAHGMWTAARCLSTLQGRLPEAYAVDVVFRAPVVLPTAVALHTAAGSTTAGSTAADGWALTLRSAGSPERIHLVMTVSATHLHR
jgi:acyl dehydratase